MKLHIKNGRLIDPANGIDASRDLYLADGRIAAVGSSNPLSTERYCGNHRSAYRGRLLAVVRANGTPGEIVLRAQADGLEGAEAVIRVAPSGA